MTRKLSLAVMIFAILALTACKDHDHDKEKGDEHKKEKGHDHDKDHDKDNKHEGHEHGKHEGHEHGKHEGHDQGAAEKADEEGIARAKEISEQVAKIWLGFIDDGQFGSSHDNAADLFRKAVTRDDWIKQVTAVRDPLGALKTRTLGSAKYTTTVPGGADGKYVILTFDSTFENKAKAVETVSLQEADPNFWRVSGYFIK